MSSFVEYLDYDLAGKLVKPCGDRSVFILDGRNSLTTMVEDAHQNNGNHRPEYPHFRIFEGDFRSARSIYTTVSDEPLGLYSGY